MKRIVILVTLLIYSIAARTQQIHDAIMTWDDFVMLIADNTDDDKGPDSELFEELYEIHCNPINLNNTTEEELCILPFLSEKDIADIISYIKKHSPLMSIGELMFIPTLDIQKRRMIQLFCYTGETRKKDFSIKNMFKLSNNELTIRSDFPFYTKEGFKDVPDSILIKSPNKVYQGNKLFHSLRYTFASQNHIFAGFQMKKDPGEEYIDHIAGYAMIKDIGCIRNAIIGNYRVSFGHGLVINTGSTFGKAMKMSSLEIIDKGITRHSSTSESGYLTGGATTLKFGKIQISAYGSFKKIDGTYNNDSSGISSLKEDGLHRTKLEKSKKGNIKSIDFGGNIHFDLNKLQLSFTTAYTHFNIPLTPKYNTKSTQYRYYNPSGKDFMAYSIAYSYRTNKLTFSGETALNSKFAIATINQLQYEPNSYNTISIIHRYYQAQYNAIHSHSFGENSKVNNENAIYAGWKIALTRKFTISSYIDAMYFPWLKYQVYGSSYGIELMTQADYTLSSSHNISLRYRMKSKQKDYNATDESDEEIVEPSTTLRYNTNHAVRIQYNNLSLSNFIFKTTLSGTYLLFGQKRSKGYSISENIRYTGIKNSRIDFSTSYFNTDNYEARIYNYESSLLYSFSMSPYYYKGLRNVLLISLTPNRHINITAKYGHTLYFNRQNIGSSLDMIKSNQRSDLQIQVRYKF